jgi:hypothetical protein
MEFIIVVQLVYFKQEEFIITEELAFVRLFIFLPLFISMVFALDETE